MFDHHKNFTPLVLLLAIVGMNIGISASLVTSAVAGLTSTHVFTLAILETATIAWIVFTLRHKNQKVVAL